MARRKKIEEHPNHERWLVSYADFITLLFAFFVVMYSISSVNEGKYRVLSDSVSTAFRPSNNRTQTVQYNSIARQITVIDPILTELAKPINLKPFVINSNNIEESSSTDPVFEEANEQVDEIADAAGESLETFIDDEEITLRRGALWLEVEINSSLLFTSASADLSVNAEEILGSIAELLNSYPNRLIVEGFTDDRPIQNSIFPSNWELSSARAASVIRLFETYGVDPFRMTSVGYGEFKPNADNVTEEGRAQNRRVVIVIMADVESQGADISLSDLELVRQGLNN